MSARTGGRESALSISIRLWRASTVARRIDLRDRVERDRRRSGPARGNEQAATLTGGLGHDVSILLGVGRQVGSQPRANTSMTIMRAPQRGHGQGSTRGASGAMCPAFLLANTWTPKVLTHARSAPRI